MYNIVCWEHTIISMGSVSIEEIENESTSEYESSINDFWNI